MDKPVYHFKASPDALVYEFDSVSASKTIKKIVVYEQLDDELYHFGFGDLTDSGEVDYQVVSGNNDMDKVLVTVVQTMLLFLNVIRANSSCSREVLTAVHVSIVNSYPDLSKLSNHYLMFRD